MDIDQGFSSKSFALLECSSPGSFYWRTCQRSLLEDYQRFSGPWPKAGTMRNGACYRQPKWERPICVKESSSLPLLPTPMAKANPLDGGSNARRKLKLLPTPTTDTNNRKKKYAQGGTPLSLAIQQWPTPTARDYRSGQGKSQAERNRKEGPSLSEAIVTDQKQRLSANAETETFPTPTACQGHNTGTIQEWGGTGNPYRNGGPKAGQISGLLNPPWVEWLMGFPIGWTDLSV